MEQWGKATGVVPEGIDREQRVALLVRQVPDGDEGDVRLRHRQGLDATSQPRHGVEAGEVKSLDIDALKECVDDL